MRKFFVCLSVLDQVFNETDNNRTKNKKRQEQFFEESEPNPRAPLLVSLDDLKINSQENIHTSTEQQHSSDPTLPSGRRGTVSKQEFHIFFPSLFIWELG